VGVNLLILSGIGDVEPYALKGRIQRKTVDLIGILTQHLIERTPHYMIQNLLGEEKVHLMAHTTAQLAVPLCYGLI
jgi:hypothetical protein